MTTDIEIMFDSGHLTEQGIYETQVLVTVNVQPFAKVRYYGIVPISALWKVCSNKYAA